MSEDIELTTKQLEVLNALKRYIEENGYSPTIRELCEIMNLKSTATIFRHIYNLKEKGYISYIEGKNRTIRILKEGI